MNEVHSEATLSHDHSKSWMMTGLSPGIFRDCSAERSCGLATGDKMAADSSNSVVRTELVEIIMGTGVEMDV